MNIDLSFSKLLSLYYQNPNPSNNDTLLFKVRQAGCNYYDNNFSISREMDYPYYTIHFIFDGCGFFHIHGQDYLLKKGDTFLIPPNQAHNYRNSSSEPLGLLWAEFSGGTCRELFAPLIGNHCYVLANLAAEQLAESLATLLTLLTSESLPDPYQISVQTYAVLVELLRIADTSPTPDPVPYVSEALTYIHTHFTQPFQISELASTLHISPAHLSRLFRKQVGMSPLKYLHMKRIEYACLLLRTTSMSVNEIASATGIYDSPCFCRMFRTICGCTPVEYRCKNSKIYT